MSDKLFYYPNYAKNTIKRWLIIWVLIDVYILYNRLKLVDSQSPPASICYSKTSPHPTKTYTPAQPQYPFPVRLRESFLPGRM